MVPHWEGTDRVCEVGMKHSSRAGVGLSKTQKENVLTKHFQATILKKDKNNETIFHFVLTYSFVVRCRSASDMKRYKSSNHNDATAKRFSRSQNRKKLANQSVCEVRYAEEGGEHLL